MPTGKKETQVESTEQVHVITKMTEKMTELSLQQGTAPQKFQIGDNFGDWERSTRRYLLLFPESQWEQRFINSLPMEAERRISVANVFPIANLDTLFTAVRCVLDHRRHKFDILAEFHSLEHQQAENMYEFARLLVDSASAAYPEASSKEIEPRVVEQFCIGLRSRKAKEYLRENQPTNIPVALERAQVSELAEVKVSNMVAIIPQPPCSCSGPSPIINTQ